MTVINDVLSRVMKIEEEVTDQILRDLITEHLPTKQKMLGLYERYKASTQGVPIFTREVPDYNKVNNQLNNDFFSEIIDTKTGYFMGKPVVYGVDRDADNFKKVDDTLQDFLVENNIQDLDSETAKRAAICGLGARLLYIDKEGLERVMLVEPWEVIFIYDRSINEPQYAMRYYDMRVTEGTKTRTFIRVEWYDETNVTFYVQDEGGVFVLDETEPVNPRPHMFEGIPLIGFLNNDEQQGDGDKVLSLIDGYDKALSDMNSEIEAFRLAYMLFFGFQPDAGTIAQAQQTGAFGITDPESGARIEFLTKDLNDAVIENHLNRLEQNILRFSKSVNFGDEQFAGNISGVAMRFKMFALESKCIMAELKFKAALRRQFKLLADVWSKKGMKVDYRMIWTQFKRNFPLNINDEANASAVLKGLVSERTRLAQLSFVEDVEYEIEQMDQEAMDLLSEGGMINELQGGPGQGGSVGEQDTGPDRKSFDSNLQQGPEGDKI